MDANSHTELSQLPTANCQPAVSIIYIVAAQTMVESSEIICNLLLLIASAVLNYIWFR